MHRSKCRAIVIAFCSAGAALGCTPPPMVRGTEPSTGTGRHAEIAVLEALIAGALAHLSGKIFCVGFRGGDASSDSSLAAELDDLRGQGRRVRAYADCATPRDSNAVALDVERAASVPDSQRLRAWLFAGGRGADQWVCDVAREATGWRATCTQVGIA